MMHFSVRKRLFLLIILLLFTSACAFAAGGGGQEVRQATFAPEKPAQEATVPEEADPAKPTANAQPTPTKESASGPAGGASQEALKERWTAPIVSYAFVAGVCDAVQETVDQQQSGATDENELAGEMLGIRLVLGVTAGVVDEWQPGETEASYKTSLVEHMSAINTTMDAWSDGSRTPEEVAEDLDQECQAVITGVEDVVEAARADGLTDESLQLILNEMEKSLSTFGTEGEEEDFQLPEETEESVIPQGPGMSRQNPFPAGQAAETPYWEVQVLEVVRGEEAWQRILAANSYNAPAPEGMEYLLARVRVKNISSEDEERSIGVTDFTLTGSKYQEYQYASVLSPEPEMEADLYPQGEAEGWVPLLADQGETGLILIFEDSLDFDENSQRFIALDEGAVQEIPAELEAIQPTGLGAKRSSPAAIGETVITDDWEITILEALRGDAAWEKIQAANSYNDPPAEGMEYVLARVQARYIGRSNRAENVSAMNFETTGSANVMHESVYTVAPAPELDAYLFPGGEETGWVVMQAKQGETGLMAVFEPLFEFDDTQRRFLKLEP